jgi:hypothetical protein
MEPAIMMYKGRTIRKVMGAGGDKSKNKNRAGETEKKEGFLEGFLI